MLTGWRPRILLGRGLPKVSRLLPPPSANKLFSKCCLRNLDSLFLTFPNQSSRWLPAQQRDRRCGKPRLRGGDYILGRRSRIFEVGVADFMVSLTPFAVRAGRMRSSLRCALAASVPWRSRVYCFASCGSHRCGYRTRRCDRGVNRCRSGTYTMAPHELSRALRTPLSGPGRRRCCPCTSIGLTAELCAPGDIARARLRLIGCAQACGRLSDQISVQPAMGAWLSPRIPPLPRSCAKFTNMKLGRNALSAPTSA